MTLTFEIRKAGFENKGAAMMLIAASQNVKARYPAARVAMAPDATSPYEFRARYGLWHRAELVRRSVDLGKIVQIVPGKLRHRFGFVTESEVDVILDAAGLAYSDQWGAQHTEDLARRAVAWKRAGKHLILLPQALGPFGTDRIRRAINVVADHADLIFARDKYSMENLVGAVGDRASIRLAPDFTNLLAASPPANPPRGEKLVAIVPNARMVDKTSSDVSDNYTGFLRRAASKFQSAGMTAFFLIHEGAGDRALAEQVNAQLSEPLQIWVAGDPLEAKGLIGSCSGLVGSRYHALISALSQGVPVIGTGWSHKYRALFEDYGCENMLVDVSAGEDDIEAGLRSLIDDGQRAALSQGLAAPGARIKDGVRQMWEDVFRLFEVD
ncbi:polysaccharide pyruvyl transferase family protein [Mesorhizobium sp. M1312]|uniref:polysaccharide pyruvyl transferase family protein n=1 Tax=unclassified Mesorhizobium TaxID=325217 RepID=UPI003338EA23